jgi:hypothetical protein
MKIIIKKFHSFIVKVYKDVVHLTKIKIVQIIYHIVYIADPLEINNFKLIFLFIVVISKKYYNFYYLIRINFKFHFK